jgi:hypothetical protein
MKIQFSRVEDLDAIERLYQQAREFQMHKNRIVWPVFSEEMIL